MNKCSRCGKHGLLSHINKSTGLCRTCEKHDAALYSELLEKNRKAAFFRNGCLYDLIPRNKSLSLYEDRGVAYEKDTVIVSDGNIYDPQKPISINDLHIPDFVPVNGAMPSVTTDLSYIMKMRCDQIEDKGYISLFIQTTLYLMDASPIGWGRDDYYQVIRNFFRLGMFAEGDRFESVYRHNNPSVFSNPFDESKEADNLASKYYWERKWRHHNEYEELKALLPEQRAALEEVCRTHPQGHYLALMYYLGCRPGEARGLMWQDVDWSAGLVHIERDIDYKDHGQPGSLKNAASRRPVPMPEPLRALLRPLRGLPDTYIAHGDRAIDRPLGKSTADRLWVRLMVAAGMAEPAPKDNKFHPSDPRHAHRALITPHALRHNYITLCWENGIDPYETMKLVGHASITTTMNIYTHLSEAQLTKTAAKLDQMFSPNSSHNSCTKVAEKLHHKN